MKNFKSAIKKLKQKRETNREIYTLEVDLNWTLIFCPQTKYYYAMDMTGASCIQSQISCIRPAYRINPETGDPDSTVLDRNNKPRKFAIKIFSGNKKSNIPMAQNELEALNENQPSDWSFTNEKQPIIVMDYHAGGMICDTDGTPNKALLNPLSLKDRLTLIFQIANQFFEIHTEKLHKKSRIHIDVKGSNILIDVPEVGPINARVIDFGSSKLLDESGNVSTGLLGVTPMTIPPEAISQNQNKFITLEDKTGSLNSKSDIYSLGAVFAAILGADDPYASRRGQFSVDTTFYDMSILNAQTSSGFDFTGLLPDSIAKLPFEMTICSQPCAFRNISHLEAPNTKTILADEKLPTLGYLLYKDQFLYIDKVKQKISGRDITSKPRTFKQKVTSISDLKDTDVLSQTHLARCIEINNSHPRDKTPVDDMLRPLIEHFIKQMVDAKSTNRPSTEEVLRFFKVANKLASMAATKDATRTNAEIELSIQIALLQLNIITYKGWNIKLPLVLPNNTISTEESGSFSQFDFDLLEQNTALFNQLCVVFSDPDILNGNKPLTSENFHFLQIHSEKKKLFDAILEKLKIPADSTQEIKQDGTHTLKEKVVELLSRDSKEVVINVKKHSVAENKLLEEKLPASSVDSTPKVITVPVANKFLSLSNPMMTCLLEEKLPKEFVNNFSLKREFFENKKFIEVDFPKMFVEMNQAVTEKSLASIGALLENAPDISLLLSHDLSDESQVADLLKHQYQVEQNKPLTSQSENMMFALYQQLYSHKEHILTLTSPIMFAKLREILIKPLLMKLQDYIDDEEALEKKGATNLKQSLFGLFGNNVAANCKAATALKEAFESGNHADFLKSIDSDETLKDSITNKTLGSISQPYLLCMRSIQKQHIRNMVANY